jgi:hypothetical protein
LCLVTMVSDARTWNEAAEELGLPPLAVNRRPAGNLLAADLLAFREGLIMLASRLAERGLVDYRARRAALADLAEMPAGDWAGRPCATGQRERHDRGRVFAAAWIWSELTGGRYDESPAWTALTEFNAPVTPMGSSRLCSKFYSNWQRSQGTCPAGLAPVLGRALSGRAKLPGRLLATSLYDDPAAGFCGDAPAGLDEHPEHGL